MDTLMLRDGRPFNQSDPGASRATSVFPPFPPTLVGAVRAALWAELGKWVPERLGDGTDWQVEGTLGPLSFGPPLVVFNGTPVFPVPLHLLEGKDQDDQPGLTFLVPGPARDCDLGPEIRFPRRILPLLGVKPIEDRWLTLAGMRKVQSGVIPDAADFIALDDLWAEEPRVGIGIERSTRTAGDGRLYLATHIRLGESTSLHIEVSGFSESEPSSKRLQPLGGEHRMAELTFERDAATLLPNTGENLPENYCAIVISPLVLAELPTPGSSIPGLPGQLISACIGKPLRIGGWNSQARNQAGKRRGRALPLREAVPPGSVFFMECDGTEKVSDAEITSGLGGEWGFGKILIGRWKDEVGT
ncbi:MAG: hypothetical protein KUG69_09100 [Marinosulfonomonas sp.]|nr:hypothetical protein [Marinosulfonomonas sp.]